jgi:pilus assembly protein Flp/PilA
MIVIAVTKRRFSRVLPPVERFVSEVPQGFGRVPHGCRKVNAAARIHAELFAFFSRAAIGSPRQWGNSMSRCKSRIVALLKDESGATAIEYGLMAAGISVVILATLNTVGSKLNAKFDEISGLLQ